MENIETLLRELTTSVNSMKTDLVDLKASKSKIDQIGKDHVRNKQIVDDLKQSSESDSLKIKLMSAIIIRQDQRITQLV